jgi:hypothetical protein
MDLKSAVELLLTFVIGGSTVYIAVQQLRLERKRENRDLRDRRMVVYRVTRNLLNAITSLGEVRPTDDLAPLSRAIDDGEVELLLAGDDCEYIKEIRKRAHDLWILSAMARQAPTEAMALKRMEGVQWMCEQLPELEKRFAKYSR